MWSLSPRTVRAALGAAALSIAIGCNEKSSSPTGPSPPPEPSTPVHYTAIGASDAIGFGGTIPCLPFADCPNGTGYVFVIARRLAVGRMFTLTNLGFPATVIAPDIQQIGTRYGRDIPGNFLEVEMPFVPPATTVVTIFAGGNDTNAIATAVDRGAGGADPLGYIDTQIRAFAQDYVTLIEGIRRRAPSTRIVAANLPNFAGLPFTAAYTLERKQVMQKISVGFSTQGVNALTSRGVIIADLLCDPRSYLASNYSSDGFHPNDAGYVFLADVLLAAIEAATPPAPQGTCAQMRLVPAI
jgi:lysophospholipase L1-like esterase